MTSHLTQHPPRSARVRLGGYAKLRASSTKGGPPSVGKQGDYKYGNPMDQHLLDFIGITKEALLEQLKTGAGDWELLIAAQVRRINPARTDLQTIVDYLDRRFYEHQRNGLSHPN